MKTKRNRLIVALSLLLSVVVLIALTWYLRDQSIPVLQPRGPVGHKERQLMILGILMSVIVVVPVYIMTVVIALKYREGSRKKRKYRPDWDSSRLFEAIWWGIPIIIIGILSVVAWQSAHSLDPYRDLPGNQARLKIQVVSMDWKWLFIYPDQKIASVNQVVIPVNTAVDFDVTSDTVMNSFWIPQLSGQIYAMPGMSTELHLSADKPGTYYGSPANISGSGFSSMTFTAKAVSKFDFAKWLDKAQRSDKTLNSASYAQLAKPSRDIKPMTYANVSPSLYDNLVIKYMSPTANKGDK